MKRLLSSSLPLNNWSTSFCWRLPFPNISLGAVRKEEKDSTHVQSDVHVLSIKTYHLHRQMQEQKKLLEAQDPGKRRKSLPWHLHFPQLTLKMEVKAFKMWHFSVLLPFINLEEKMNLAYRFWCESNPTESKVHLILQVTPVLRKLKGSWFYVSISQYLRNSKLQTLFNTRFELHFLCP